MNIQWYPGHMTKAVRELKDSLKLVDFVCEIIDARVPVSSRNPDLDEIISQKARLIVLNRADLADEAITNKWLEYLTKPGQAVIKTDSKSGKGIGSFSSVATALMADKIARDRAKGQRPPLRAMVVGIPNVGKSSFINRLTGKRSAKTEDRPGVTRKKQWFSAGGGFELLDTPGVLWPKLEGENVGLHLAFTGAIRDEIIDIEELASHFLDRIKVEYADNIKQRYKFDIDASMPGYEMLPLLAKKRGYLVSGGEADTERMSKVLLDEYRAGLLGRITLESPPTTI